MKKAAALQPTIYKKKIHTKHNISNKEKNANNNNNKKKQQKRIIRNGITNITAQRRRERLYICCSFHKKRRNFKNFYKTFKYFWMISFLCVNKGKCEIFQRDETWDAQTTTTNIIFDNI